MRSLLAAAVTTVMPLAQAQNATIELTSSELPTQFGAATALRQGIIGLISAVVMDAPGSHIRIDANQPAEFVELVVTITHSETPVLNASAGGSAALRFAERLVQLAGGSLTTRREAERWSQLRLTLPGVEPRQVLVIDDNADALRLMARYLVGSPFRFTGTHDPEQVLQLALPSPTAPLPAAIVLDVMLPGIDGWDLMGRLREHPQLGSVPVIISTILPQEPLALALGAAGFLQKPFTQDEFLSVLIAHTR